MRMRTVLIGAAALVVGVVVAGVAIISSMDFNQYRGLIADQAKAATGRDLTIKGDLKLALGLSPSLAVNDVSFANASWGTRPDMLRIGRFEAQVELLPLITGTIKVARIVLIGADVLLETDKDGRGNWEFAGAQPATSPPTQPSAPGGATNLPQISEVIVRDAKLTYRDGKTGDSNVVAIERVLLNADSATSPLRLDVAGAATTAQTGEVKFTANGELGSIARMAQSSGAPWPINVTARVADALTLRVTGGIQAPSEGRGLNLTIGADAPEIQRLAAIAKQSVPALGPFKAEINLTDGAPNNQISLPRLSIQAGKPELATLKVDGRIAEPLAQRGIDLTASLDVREIGTFSNLQLPGQTLPPIPALGPFKADLRVVNGPGNRPSVPEFKIDFGKPETIKLDVAGSFQDPTEQRGLTVTLRAAAADMAAPFRAAQMDPPARGPLLLEAKLSDTAPGRYEIAGLKLEAGPDKAVDLSGDIRLAMPQGAKPSLTAMLQSNQIDLVKLQGPQPAQRPAPAPAPRQATPAAPSDGRVIPNEPLPFDQLNLADADVRLRAAKIVLPDATMSSFNLQAVIKDGILTVKPMTFELDGGKFNLSTTANAATKSLTQDIEVRDLQLGKLLEERKLNDYLRGGNTVIDVELRGSGATARAYAASLEGSAFIHVGQGELGQAASRVIGDWLKTVMPPLAAVQIGTSVRCVVHKIDFSRGIGTYRAGLVDTGVLNARTAGTINLGTEQLALTQIAGPVGMRIGGTFAEPSVIPDPALTGAAVLQGVGNLAGGIVQGGAGAVGGILGAVTGQQGGQQQPARAATDACAQALADAGRAGAAPAAAPSPAPQQAPAQQAPASRPAAPAPPAAPANPLDGLRNLFGR